MKKMILMAAFAAFSFAVNAQNAPATAEKTACANKSASCCTKSAGTASTASTAAVTPEVKSVSKSKAKKACCAGAPSSACGEAKAEKKDVN
jgi:hypothetical protein